MLFYRDFFRKLLFFIFCHLLMSGLITVSTLRLKWHYITINNSNRLRTQLVNPMTLSLPLNARTVPLSVIHLHVSLCCHFAHRNRSFYLLIYSFSIVFFDHAEIWRLPLTLCPSGSLQLPRWSMHLMQVSSEHKPSTPLYISVVQVVTSRQPFSTVSTPPWTSRVFSR